MSWRRGKSGRNYPHIEPHPKSQTQLRDKLREKLNHWTQWRAADEVIPEVNRLLKGWGGYFHYANSTRVFDRLNQDAAAAATLALAQERMPASPVENVSTGSSAGTSWPVSAAHAGCVDAGAGVAAMRVNDPRKAGCGKTARPV